MNTGFSVSSVTYAMRGKTLLEQRGISAHVERQTAATSRQGCGYRIIVRDHYDEAKQILLQNNIKIYDE